MAFDAGSVVAKIIADITQFKEGLNEAKAIGQTMGEKIKGGVDGMNKSIKTMTPNLLKASATFGVIGAAGTLMIKDWVANANEAARTQTQLDAVIKSTKGAAGITADEVNNLASKYQNLTTMGDDTIRAGQNILLTFTGIKKDAFEPATAALLDMATAMNNGATPTAEQLTAQATQLGKALNDPTKGIAALSRNGVVFTDEQAAMIQKLQESGDLLGAQKIILNELANEYGGSAAAQTQTFEGRLAQLNNRFGDFKETLGFAVIPVLEQLVGIGEKIMTWFESLSPSMQGLIAKVVLFGTAFALLAAPLLLFVTMIPALIAGFTAIGAGISFIGAPILAVIAAVGLLFLAWQTNFLGIRDILNSFIAFIAPWFSAINTVVQEHGGWLRLIPEAWNIVVTEVTAFVQVLAMNIKMWFDIISLTWKTFWQNIYNFFVGVKINIQLGIQALFDTALSIFNTGAGILLGAWQTALGGLQSLASSIWEGIKSVFKNGVNQIIQYMNNIISGYNAVVKKVPGLKSLALPEIPRLAEGGIVKAQPGGIVANIGEGRYDEAIVPLDGKSGFGNHYHFHDSIISSKEAAREMFDAAFGSMRPNLG